MTETGAIIVVLGTDSDGKRRAARFADTQADLARKAADMPGFHTIRVTEPALKKVAAKLEGTKLAVDGTGTLPVAAGETYDKLAKLIGTPAELKTTTEAPTSPTPPSTAKPSAPSRDAAAKPPADPWEAISTGSMVLCYDVADEAWYEAVVLAVGADKQSLTMRWRDYPGEGRFTALRDKVALTKPRAS
ncbi:MAG: hypothetical protein WD294_04265 [Phycisphaeraceae bacterium]